MKKDDFHERKCWPCGNVAQHASRIVPDVLCKICGSQNTRPIKKPKTEPSKPWLRYATALTAEQMAALLADGAVNLNLYVTSECWVQVTIFRSDAGDIADSSVVESCKNYPIPGA